MNRPSPDSEEPTPRTHRGSGWEVAGAGLSVAVIFVAVLSLPLTTAGDLGLSARETTSWLVALYGLSGILSFVLVLRFRQPLLLTGNIFILLFIDRLGTTLPWSELVGAAIVAGVIVLLVGPLGLTDTLSRWLPAPIVFGLLAGLVFDFFVRMFDLLGESPLLVGGTLITYLLARRVTSVPPILPALVVGSLLAVVTGHVGSVPVELSWPAVDLTSPTFSVAALLTATPVLVVLITVQANVPSIVYLRAQHYEPPEATIGAMSGLGTAIGSLLGPTGISLSLPATALSAGPDAGRRSARHRSVYIGAGAAIGIALLAGFAAQLAAIVPGALLVTIVGLAVVEILVRALRTVSEGPLVLGPLFAFGIAFSNLSLLGLDALFWALVGGIGISLLLERDKWPEGSGSETPF